MKTRTELQEQIADIKREVQALFIRQHRLENEYDQLLAQDMLESGELRSLSFIYFGRSLESIVNSHTNDQFIDKWFPSVNGSFWLQLTDSITISGNADDGDIYIQGDTFENLCAFADQYTSFDTQVLRTIADKYAQIDQLKREIKTLEEN